MRAFVSGTGSYLPKRVVTNEELSAMVPNCDPDWISRKLGIEARRFAADDEQTSDLAKKAAERALAAARLVPSDLDGIICTVGIGDVIEPGTSAYLQHALGATGVSLCYDIKAACAGALVGILNARALIESGLAKHILIVGTYIASRTTIDFNERATAPIFGDGAGALVLSRSEHPERGVIMSKLHSDGSLTEIVGRYGGGTRDPLTPEVVEARKHLLKMDGRAVWDCAIRVLPEVVREAVEDAGLELDEIDFFVAHQANKRLLEAVLGELGVSADRTYTNIEQYGNTGPASFLIALDDAVRLEKVKPGQNVVFLAIGAGMTWGAHVVRW